MHDTEEIIDAKPLVHDCGLWGYESRSSEIELVLDFLDAGQQWAAKPIAQVVPGLVEALVEEVNVPLIRAPGTAGVFCAGLASLMALTRRWGAWPGYSCSFMILPHGQASAPIEVGQDDADRLIYVATGVQQAKSCIILPVVVGLIHLRLWRVWCPKVAVFWGDATPAAMIERKRTLFKLGIKGMRFEEADILEDPLGCANAVATELQDRKGIPPEYSIWADAFEGASRKPE